MFSEASAAASDERRQRAPRIATALKAPIAGHLTRRASKRALVDLHIRAPTRQAATVDGRAHRRASPQRRLFCRTSPPLRLCRRRSLASTWATATTLTTTMKTRSTAPVKTSRTKMRTARPQVSTCKRDAAARLPSTRSNISDGSIRFAAPSTIRLWAQSTIHFYFRRRLCRLWARR